MDAPESALTIVLPNMNVGAGSFPLVSADNEAERLVLEFIKKNGSITRKEAEATVDMNQTAAGRLLSKMIQKNLIVQTGQGKNTKYKLP